jgi:hypothetical protein
MLYDVVELSYIGTERTLETWKGGKHDHLVDMISIAGELSVPVSSYDLVHYAIQLVDDGEFRSQRICGTLTFWDA